MRIFLRIVLSKYSTVFAIFFAEKILGGLGDFHQQAVYMGTIYVACQTPLIDVR